MGLNKLLIWMSARVEGSWPQFRAAVEEFHASAEGSQQSEDEDSNRSETLPIYQSVRLTFQRLAHVEFFAPGADADWKVAPPTLAIAKKTDHAMGVICGARSPAILQMLSVNWPGINVDVQTSTEGVDCIRLRANENELRSFANSTGIDTQEDAPTALLAAIPAVDDARSRSRAQPPTGPGWTIERFSTSKLRWERHEHQSFETVQTGMFRMKLGFQRFNFRRCRGHTYKCAVQVGKFAVLKHARIQTLLTYDAKRAQVSVPVICRPPLFVERALLLCSGILPRFNASSARLEYTDVPIEIALAAARSLRQELVIQ